MKNRKSGDLSERREAWVFIGLSVICPSIAFLMSFPFYLTMAILAGSLFLLVIGVLTLMAIDRENDLVTRQNENDLD